MSDKVIKVDNAELDVKVAVRDWCMERLGGAANCNVCELYGGEGVMYDACYTDVRSHVAFDLKPIQRKGWLCGDARVLWEAHAKDGFNLVDCDAYGVPWVMLNDVMRLIPPTKRFAVAITDGQIRRLQIGGIDGFTRQVINYAGLPASGLLAQWREDIVRWMMLYWKEQHHVQVLEAVQGKSTSTKVHYFGLLCEKKK